MTCRDKLLSWFATRSTITPAEAMTDLGIYRLGARIHELRRDGYNIRTEMLSVPNRDGTVTHPARYHYEGQS